MPIRHNTRSMERKILAAMLVGLLAAGCGSSNKLVGIWKMTMSGTPATQAFYAEGRTAVDVTMPEFAKAKIHITGKWRQKGDQILITPTGIEAVDLPDRYKFHEDEFRNALQWDDRVNHETANTIKWNGDNSFTLTSPNGSTTYTRQEN